MGQYKEKMDDMQKILPRDPFDDEESVKRRDDTLFGNPYFKKKKLSSLSKQNEYPSIESPDSIMDEADEEASHEFEKELTKPNDIRLSTRRKRYVGKKGDVPYLYKKPLLSFPSFKGLRWNQLSKYEYSYVAGLGDLVVDSVVKEFESAPTTPSYADQSAEHEEAIKKLHFSEKIPDLDVHSVISSDAVDDDIHEVHNQSDWKLIRKKVHSFFSKWPKCKHVLF